MKGKYVYGVLSLPDGPLPTLKGIGGQQVYSLTHDRIGAAVSDVCSQGNEFLTEELLLHEQIVEKLMGHTTILPVRFGTVLPDDFFVERLLKTNYSEFLADLLRLRGKAEMGVKVLWPVEELEKEIMETREYKIIEEKAASKTGGQRYLWEKWKRGLVEHKLAEKAQNLEREIDLILRKTFEEKKIQTMMTRKIPVNASYLVKMERINAFVADLHLIRDSHPRLKFLITGPWPSYNFISVKCEE